MDLLKYFENAKKSYSKFQYSYTLDEEKRSEHIFWSYASCFDLYKKYKVNSYEMTFEIFVSMNSHEKTILFGCALLRNETMTAFRCLMKITIALFLCLLFNLLIYSFLYIFIDLTKKPLMTILIDQDPWMKEVITEEMSSIKYCLCIWHITFKYFFFKYRD